MLIGIILGVIAGVAAGFLAGRRWGASGAHDRGVRAALDTADTAVLITTPDGMPLHHNAQTRAVFGATDEELRGQPLALRYADPADRGRHVEALYRNGKIAEEVTFRAASGIFSMQVNAGLLPYGGVTSHVFWLKDTSAEQRSDSMRRELDARLAIALEATGAAAWDADVVAGTCWWSDTFPRMLGFDHIPVMASGFWEERLHPDDRGDVLDRIAAHFRGETELYDYVYRLRREDGSWIWVEAKGRCMRDSAGRAIRYVGVMTDITERRRQEEQLRGSEERLYHLLDTSPIAVNITTFDGKFIYFNAQTANLLREPRETVMTLPIAELYADPAERDRMIARFHREGRFRDAEMSFRRLDGSVFWVLASWDSIEMDGQKALLTWLYDITDRKEAEVELKAAKEEAERTLDRLRSAQESLIQAETMASLGELVAAVAHEVNTPLGIGLTAASHIADRTREMRARFDQGALRKSEMADYLDSVAESARLMVNNAARAAELVQSFKQVAVDQTSGGRRSFELKTYIEEVVFSLHPRLKRSTVLFELDCPDDVVMDSFPGALSQVITNLVINALIHAYADGTRPGTIRLTAQRAGSETVVITFADDGAGIPPENLSRIFEPFFTTRRGDGGSGLGLHIVFNTVTQTLGGTVAVDSRVGEGTRFTLTLPLAAPLQDETSP